ncbi:MAG: SIR2 family protein [Syntrophorhabdales bacterium]
MTPNYDDYLDREAQKPLPSTPSVSEDAGEEKRATGITARGKVITPKDGLLISGLSNGNVVHLHGGINDEGSAVITIVDYMKHYERRSRAAVLLETIFREYTVLFVGYGLEEYEVMEFMITKAQTARNEVR